MDSNKATSAGGATPVVPVQLYVVRLSPPCRAVWIYMLQNKINHELIDVDFTQGEESTPEFIIKNPHQEVPILVDDDIVAFEGQAILRYLATTYTNFAGYGNTARERALCESIISWASSELHRVVGYYYTYPQFLDRFRLPSDSANEALIEAGIKGMTKHLETLEKRYLQKSPYLVGDEITMADTMVATILCQAEWVGFKFKIWPRVNQWLDNVKQQEFWDRVHDAHYQFLRELEQEVTQFD